MAKIPEYFSQAEAETSRLPRAPAGLADTGQGLEAQALADIGGALGKVGQALADIEIEKQRARDNVTLAEMKGVLDDFEFESRPDPAQFKNIEDFKKAEDKYGKDWQRESQRISKGSNRRVADQFKIYTELHWDTARKDYHNKSWPLEQNYALAQFDRLWSEKLQKFVSKPVKLKGELKALIEQFGTYLKPTQKQALEAGIDEQIATAQKQDMLNKLHVAAKIMPFERAISYLNDIEGLTSAERNDLIARRKRQNEIETATTNRQVRWDTLLKISKDPASVTDEFLEGLIKPDSLTWDDAEELRSIRDKDNHPLKRADSVRAFTFLEELKDIRIATLKAAMKDDPTITSDTLREELLQQFQMKNDLEQWILEKDRTTEEIEKKVGAMTTPVASDIALNWFERMFWIGRPQFFGLVGTEAERLARKQKKAQVGGIPPLKGFEEDLSKLTDEELEAIIRGK